MVPAVTIATLGKAKIEGPLIPSCQCKLGSFGEAHDVYESPFVFETTAAIAVINFPQFNQITPPMYNGPHKFGRGGGGGGGRGGGSGGGSSKRKSFPPPPQRHSTPSNRVSLSRTSYSSAPPPRPEQQSADESFHLVSGEPLSLATIFRLHPELVDDIRRLEAQGGAAKIKFDSNPKSDANVIDVGGKEYRFTWADEKNCDIYEERQGGEDGNGLLVETGYVWRKLTTKRELDESTKRQVKMRSLQCEQSHKSRTTKPMEPGNPSMKNQMKALVEAKASPWNQKQKKDSQFKTRNFESSQAGAAKPVQRPQLSSTNSIKGRHSNSPLPSPQNQYIHLASPSARGSASESRTTCDPAISEARAKVNVGSSNKIVSPTVTARMQEGAPHRDNLGAGVLDMERLLITLLKDNSKGMTLKAMEKAVGDVTSSSARRIDPILKKIATYEPPGKYILKPGLALGIVRSSPEDKHQKQFVPRDSGIAGKSPAHDNEDHVPLNNKFEGESNEVANSAPSQHLTDLFGDNEHPDHNESHAVSSSNSDSDTESGSTDSGTKSASRSRSRSPIRSASATSSDSEADSSSNNKETSDVEIDIMSDDDKEPKKLQDPPMPWSMLEGRANENNGDQDGNESEDVDIENDFLGDNEAELATSSHDLCLHTENIKLVSHDQDQQQTDDDDDDDDKFKHKHFDSVLNSDDKSKRGSNVVQNTDNSKRVKGRSLAQPPVSGYMGSHNLRSPAEISPETQNVNHRDNRILQMTNQQNRNDNSNVESVQSSRRPPVRSHATDNADKPPKNPLTFGIDAKDQEMNALGDITKQGYTDLIEAQDEDGSINEKGNGSPLGQRSSMRPEPPYKHHNARSKKSSDISTRGQSSLSLNDTRMAVFNSSTKDRRLQRELSDLEMGEFREPLAEEPDKSNKLFDRVSSFKKSESKLGTGSRNVDLKANLPNQGTLDPGNGSSPNLRGPPKKTDLSKRRSPDPCAEDLGRLQRDTKSQQQNSRSVRDEVEPLPNQAVDLNRWENEDTFVHRGTDVEGYGETLRKSYDSASHEDFRQELDSQKGKGKKSRKSKGTGGEDKRRDVSVSRVDKRKRNEPSSDDNISYSKYEKDEPELKEPIKSFSQYKEYVQEYREKYDSYCSLNKILENYRNEFQKLGLDLESAKGRDMERYYSILGQLRDSYRQCGTRHKRLKKIFVLLHEELKGLKQRIKDFAVEYMRD
ncbi:hypothetical protein KSS87_021685 [Heliosperma pusillum]|nr:hypothetical protein KSS87_021685 [Heliosperma pusillum]